MRTLALLLLLMNIAFFAWQQQLLPWLPWQPELLQPEPAPTYRATLPQLVLLSEREAAQATLPPPVPAAEKTPKSEQKVEQMAKEEHSTKVETPPVAPAVVATESAPPPAATEVKPHLEPNSPTPAEKVEKTVVAETVTPPQAQQEQNEPISFQKLAMRLISQGQVSAPSPQQVQNVPVSETMPPAQTPEIIANPTQLEVPQQVVSSQTEPPTVSHQPEPVKPVTVSTPVAATSTVEAQNKTLPVLPTKTNKTEVVCYQIGYFSQLGEAQAASNWFKKKQVTTAPQKSDTRLATTIWLYLPAARSLQSAHATQQRLKQQGIADTVVINRPDGYTVSLGVYRDKASVSKRLQELRNKGVDNVNTEERYATETKYWLNVKIVANPSALLSQFQKAFKGLQTKTIICDDLR